MDRIQLVRWAPVMKELAVCTREGSLLEGFRRAARYAQKDPEFLEWWLRQAQTYDEPIRGRLMSFLRRLRRAEPDWNFEEEFWMSFN